MTDDIYNSTKIEGNSLTKREVTYYLANHVTLRGKPLKDIRQVDNYEKMVHHIGVLIKENRFVLSKETICNIHKSLTEGELPPGESGVFRNDIVTIGVTTFMPPDHQMVPGFIEEAIAHYYDTSDALKTDFERICEFKRNFERIHPFFDGNGRTGRILANVLFLQSGYGYITIPEELRNDYFDSIENNTLHEFFAERMIESMEYINDLHRTKDIIREKEL